MWIVERMILLGLILEGYGWDLEFLDFSLKFGLGCWGWFLFWDFGAWFLGFDCSFA